MSGKHKPNFPIFRDHMLPIVHLLMGSNYNKKSNQRERKEKGSV